MDFAIGVYGSVEIFGLEFLFTETMRNTLIIMLGLLIFGVYVRIQSRKWDFTKKPTGLQNVLEIGVDAFDKLFKGNTGEKVHHLIPWFFSLFVFLFISNIIGITGLRPPTADWGMTFPLAASSFFLFQYAGIRSRPKGYLRGIFIEPSPVFAPLNVIGELARPIALSFRLFGNILGGMILLQLLYGMAPILLQLVFPTVLHMYFDLAAGLLQAFIFTMLSIAFVGLASEG